MNRPTRILIGAALAVALIVAAFLVFVWKFASGPSPCSVAQVVPSPGGEFIAVLLDWDGGATTGHERQVLLQEPTLPVEWKEENSILAIEGSPDLKMVWHGDRSLEIVRHGERSTAPEKLRPRFLMRRWGNVTIRFTVTGGK